MGIEFEGFYKAGLEFLVKVIAGVAVLLNARVKVKVIRGLKDGNKWK